LTETQAVSNSSVETLWRYLKSRLPARLYLPCAALLVMAGLAGGHSPNGVELAVSCVLAFTLLLQFRLLDDVSDLPHDRHAHPDRVLVRATSLAPFYVLLLLSGLWNLALIALQIGPGHRLGALLLLNAAYLLWYLLLRKIVTDRVVGYHVVAAKYPVFVYLVSGDGPNRWSLLLAMGLIFLCFTIYEVLHDRSLDAVPRAEKALRLEICAFAAISALMTVELIGSMIAMVVLQGLLAVMGLLVLGEAFGRRRVHLKSPRAGYLVFAVAFALILSFSLGVRS
jgi:4-hydroxybenzoate polyprenyltransferase